MNTIEKNVVASRFSPPKIADCGLTTEPSGVAPGLQVIVTVVAAQNSNYCGEIEITKDTNGQTESENSADNEVEQQDCNSDEVGARHHLRKVASFWRKYSESSSSFIIRSSSATLPIINKREHGISSFYYQLSVKHEERRCYYTDIAFTVQIKWSFSEIIYTNLDLWYLQGIYF